VLHGLVEVRLMTRALPYHRGQPPTALSPSDNGGPVALLSLRGRVTGQMGVVMKILGLRGVAYQ